MYKYKIVKASENENRIHNSSSTILKAKPPTPFGASISEQDLILYVPIRSYDNFRVVFLF